MSRNNLLPYAVAGEFLRENCEYGYCEKCGVELLPDEEECGTLCLDCEEEA